MMLSNCTMSSGCMTSFIWYRYLYDVEYTCIISVTCLVSSNLMMTMNMCINMISSSCTIAPKSVHSIIWGSGDCWSNPTSVNIFSPLVHDVFLWMVTVTRFKFSQRIIFGEVLEWIRIRSFDELLVLVLTCTCLYVLCCTICFERFMMSSVNMLYTFRVFG